MEKMNDSELQILYFRADSGHRPNVNTACFCMTCKLNSFHMYKLFEKEYFVTCEN